MDKLVIPEFELWVLDELDEGDEETPWVRTIDDEPFQEDARHLLLDRFRVRLGEQIEQRAAEVVRVAVRIAQLVGNSIQE